MAMFTKERLSFNVEWFQEDAGLMRNYLLTFFPSDKSVEMFDTSKNKIFLRRCAVPDLTEKHFYIGAKLNIFGRIVIVKAYEDDYTKNKMTKQRQRAFALIPTENLSKLSKIIKVLCDNGFSISNCAMFELSRQQSNILITELALCNSDIFSSGPSVALLLTGCDAVHRLKMLLAGPERQTNEKCADLIFGSGAMTDAVLCPESSEDISKMCELFFAAKSSDGNNLCLSKSLKNSTLCLIKPHAMLEGKCGDILCQISENGFVIKAMKMFNLQRQNCEEFYEVYKGVTRDYSRMVTELSSGPFLAIEIGCANSNELPYSSFRQLCGPFDPEIAREIRPKTIRARFGVDIIKNAVHCTDLEEDCLLEVEYFFKILSQ